MNISNLLVFSSGFLILIRLRWYWGGCSAKCAVCSEGRLGGGAASSSLQHRPQSPATPHTAPLQAFCLSSPCPHHFSLFTSETSPWLVGDGNRKSEANVWRCLTLLSSEVRIEEVTAEKTPDDTCEKRGWRPSRKAGRDGQHQGGNMVSRPPVHLGLSCLSSIPISDFRNISAIWTRESKVQPAVMQITSGANNSPWSLLPPVAL